MIFPLLFSLTINLHERDIWAARKSVDLRVVVKSDVLAEVLLVEHSFWYINLMLAFCSKLLVREIGHGERLVELGVPCWLC